LAALGGKVGVEFGEAGRLERLAVDVGGKVNAGGHGTKEIEG
jgi:hypothetical protein